jgi:type II secretory pathway component GspD/PulD (secretin)
MQVALGRANTAITGSSDDVILATRAKVQRLVAETQAHYDRGMTLLADGEIQSAIGSLHLAQANIASAPFQMDWAGLDASIESSLSMARAEFDATLAANRAIAEQDTFTKLRIEADAAAARDANRRQMVFKDGVSAFIDADYDAAISHAEDLLQANPLDAQALELRDSSRRARHERISSDFQEERGERFLSWVEDNEEAMIPTTGILQAPDPEYWASISELRKRFRETIGDTADDPANASLMSEIASSMVPGLQFDGETSLEAVVAQLRMYTDVPFVVSPSAIEAVDAEGIEFNLNLANELTVENALNIIADAAGPDVAYVLRNGVVYLTSSSDAMGELILRAHDVQDLTAVVHDFTAPKIKDIRLPDDESLIETDEAIFGGVTEEARQIINEDNLETLIQASIAPTTWDELEGVSIAYQNGFLTIRHTAEVQNQVADFLNSLRDYNSTMVTIEARFLTITKDYLREIGVDWRGLGGGTGANDLVNLDDLTSGLEDDTSLGLDNDGAGLPDAAESNPSAGMFLDEGGDGDIRARTENILGEYGERLTNFGGLTMQFAFLDDLQYSFLLRAVEKSQHSEVLQSTSVSAQNTQRAYMTMLNQVTYVQDFEIQVAQAALIADPVIGVISDGIALDVRPTISEDRDYISLEIRPTVATLLRPISEFTSSLAGLTTPVTLQLPELQVASVETTVKVPDGGTVLIGGLKKLMNLEQRAEVPFLADIPVLSMLFKAEGEASESQDIIILLTARITDAKEVAAKLSN